MKKNIITIMMAFAALLMTQCKKQAEHQNADPAGDKIEVTVRLESNTDKTEISPSGTITWKRGDALLIVGEEDGPLGYVFATTGGSTSACFEGMIMPFGQDQVLRFYQLDLNSSWTVDDDIFTFEILEQDGTLEGIAAHNQLMFGKTSAPVTAGSTNFGTISMTSLIAIAHMDIEYNEVPVSPITMTGINSMSFDPMTFDGTNFTPAVGDISLTFTSPTSSTDCYIALLPGTQTLIFTANGCEATLSEKNVESNSFYSNNGDPVHVVLTAAENPVEGVTDGHSWINFNDQPGETFGVSGLPLWAKYNVGVDESNLTTAESYYGKYYAWGETAALGEPMVGEGLCAGPYYNPGQVKNFEPGADPLPWYKWAYEPWFDEGLRIGKYNETDAKTTLDLEDDAVFANWGGSWHMPTSRGDMEERTGEWFELIANTYWKYEYNYNRIEGLNGYVVYKVKNAADRGLATVNSKDSNNPEQAVWKTYDMKISTYNHYIEATLTAEYSLTDPHMFLPVAGTDGDYDDQGIYWSNSLYTEDYDCTCANILQFRYKFLFESGIEREHCFTVRSVRDYPNVSGNGDAHSFDTEPW